MKTFYTFLFSITIVFTVNAQWPSSLVGRWTFDDQANPLVSTTGEDLVLVGTHQAIAGPAVDDNAVRIGAGSYYRCFHGIEENGGVFPSSVNNYTLLIDFRINDISSWKSLFQTQPSNNNDAECFINTSGNIGVGATGYTETSAAVGEWYRLVISVKLGSTPFISHYDYYIDGLSVLSGTNQAADGRFSLYPSTGLNELLFFADDNGEDGEIDVAQIAIFNTDLSSSEISTLGGFSHGTVSSGVKPYLQGPTSTSMYISWHTTLPGSTLVKYGTTNLDQQTTGDVEDISGKKWHTVQLTGLQPNTEYMYQCVNGTSVSDTFHLSTPPNPGTSGSHIRFAIIGDSRTDIAQSSSQALQMKEKMEELFGTDLHNQIDLIFHVGDIVTSGSSISQYEDEYFNPYAPLSSSIPFMVTIGNHENENSSYYKYMKQEDFSDYEYPNPLAERFYSFYLGNTQFIAINSNSIVQNSFQTAWFEDELRESEARGDIDFVFSFSHHPAHSEIWPDGNDSYVQNSIIGLLQNYYKTQAHTYGHSHNYERGVIQSAIASTIGDFRIMLSGGAGCSLDRWGMYPNQQDYQEVHKSLDQYCFVIYDIDMDNKSYIGRMYSFGNEDFPRDCELLDTWHRNLLQPAPDKPIAYAPSSNAQTTPMLISSPFSGMDSIMSSEFQITDYPGLYMVPIVDQIRDWENIYGDTGFPNFTPIDLNEGIDLYRYQVNSGILEIGSTYGWRVRYRDHNLRWSVWSDEQVFTVVNNIVDSADFIADTTIGLAPFTVQFTDLSYPTPATWEWDFDGDGNTDSNEQNPTFTYTSSGVFTVTLEANINSNIITQTKDFYINTQTTEIREIDNSSAIGCFPNPFSEKVSIQFTKKQKGYAKIVVYNNNGELVKTLLDEMINEGSHSIEWNAQDETGSPIKFGVYYLKYTDNKDEYITKIIYVK
jgi:hypothetical protein